jgi:AcrR family transcriptional regulator
MVDQIVTGSNLSKMYSTPKQQRGFLTEQRFLDALDKCLHSKSFSDTSVEEIASTAGLHRGAFLKRFGSKKGALKILYSRYCSQAHDEIRRIRDSKSEWSSALMVCKEASVGLERIQKQSFACNRAMQELFIESLTTDEQTKDIFLAAVLLLREIQEGFFPENSHSESGALAATQLMVTVNYNFLLNAMPALPREADQRHSLIAECMVLALRSH